MKIKDGYVLRQIAGNSVVIATGQEAINFNGIVTINGAGAFLWKKLTDGATEEELLSAMLGEYDVDEATAKKDIDEFIGKLREAELLCD